MPSQRAQLLNGFLHLLLVIGFGGVGLEKLLEHIFLQPVCPLPKGLLSPQPGGQSTQPLGEFRQRAHRHSSITLHAGQGQDAFAHGIALGLHGVAEQHAVEPKTPGVLFLIRQPKRLAVGAVVTPVDARCVAALMKALEVSGV